MSFFDMIGGSEPPQYSSEAQHKEWARQIDRHYRDLYPHLPVDLTGVVDVVPVPAPVESTPSSQQELTV